MWRVLIPTLLKVHLNKYFYTVEGYSDLYIILMLKELLWFVCSFTVKIDLNFLTTPPPVEVNSDSISLYSWNLLWFLYPPFLKKKKIVIYINTTSTSTTTTTKLKFPLTPYYNTQYHLQGKFTLMALPLKFTPTSFNSFSVQIYSDFTVFLYCWHLLWFLSFSFCGCCRSCRFPPAIAAFLYCWNSLRFL